jgi:HEAT repeat protein
VSETALADALAGSDPVARAHALSALAARVSAEGPSAIDAGIARALLLPLGSSSRTEQRHAADLVAPLAASSPVLLAVLREALAASESRLRWGAAYALGRALPPTRELWPSVLETMRLEDGDQRWAAAELACRIARRDPAVAVEIRAALADPSPTLRKMVLYCLRDLRDPGAVAAARALLSDGDAGVRLAALATLTAVCTGERADTATAERVAALLGSDDDAGVRRAAAVALGKLGVKGPAVVTALLAAARADDPSLARASAGALRALGLPG